MRYYLIIIFFTVSSVAYGQKKTLLFSDNFSNTSIDSNWIVETSPFKGSSVSIKNGKLILDTQNGVTIWYKHPISGDIQIEFTRKIIMDSGINDRLSDMNQFWMVTDPQQKMFSRKGGFKEYDSLQMYYVGMGGNYNTTTRMRRYDGRGELKIVGEYKDSSHLLQANKTYHIKILVQNGNNKFYVDDILFFEFKDEQAFNSGWFALRSTKSRQEIDDVKIWALDSAQ